MGIGHRQQNLFKTNWKHQLCHGGLLRQKKAGRGSRALATKEPLHLVFKVHRDRLRHRGLRSPQCFLLISKIINSYSKRFFIKVEQLSIQGDHIHLLVRAPRRSSFQSFFRVVAGQIAQQFQKQSLLRSSDVTDTPKIQVKGTKLWKYRPYSRVVRGYRAYLTAKDYIYLNEKEARGEIKYQKQRLKGLSSSDWKILWS